MSKKSSKTSFRSLFPKRDSVMPIRDEEAGQSQNSGAQSSSNETENQYQGHQNVAGNAKNKKPNQPDRFSVTNEKLRDSSKTSLPASFGKDAKKIHRTLIPFGSHILRSMVTPPRGHSLSKVEDFRQQTINNNAEAGQNENNNIGPSASLECTKHCETPIKHTISRDSTNDLYCRICHDSPSKMILVSPCLCKGTMGLVHRSCLERWLGESGKSICEICGYEYVTQRKPKYTGCSSLYHWLRHPVSPADTRNLVFDLACFCILTPLAGVSAWLCVLGAQHYTFGQESRRFPNGQMQRSEEPTPSHRVRGRNIRYPDGTNSTWTSVGLLTLTGTLLSAYIVWLVVAFRFHLQVFRDWQNKNFMVTIVPMSEAEQTTAHVIRDTETALNRSIPRDADGVAVPPEQQQEDLEQLRQPLPIPLSGERRRILIINHLELVNDPTNNNGPAEDQSSSDSSEKSESDLEVTDSAEEFGSLSPPNVEVDSAATVDVDEIALDPEGQQPGPLTRDPDRTNSCT